MVAAEVVKNARIVSLRCTTTIAQTYAMATIMTSGHTHANVKLISQNKKPGGGRQISRFLWRCCIRISGFPYRQQPGHGVRERALNAQRHVAAHLRQDQPHAARGAIRRARERRGRCGHKPGEAKGDEARCKNPPAHPGRAGAVAAEEALDNVAQRRRMSSDVPLAADDFSVEHGRRTLL